MHPLYDAERMQVIGSVMPEFSNLVKEGDTVCMGLEGDSMFPSEYRGARPVGTVTKKVIHDNKEVSLTLNFGENEPERVVSSFSIKPTDVYELTDATFKRVMHAEKQLHAEKNAETKYGNAESRTLDKLNAQIDVLAKRLETQEYRSKELGDTLIASLEAVARDVCTVSDATNSKPTEFCHNFTQEYRAATSQKTMMDTSQNRAMPNAQLDPFNSDMSDSSDEEYA